MSSAVFDHLPEDMRQLAIGFAWIAGLLEASPKGRRDFEEEKAMALTMARKTLHEFAQANDNRRKG